MAFPAGWDLVNVTGTYIGRNGVPSVGTVTFSSPQMVLRSGTIVPAADIVFTLDASGSFIGQIPATDDPNASPTGWVYSVTENVPGGRQGYLIVAPHTSPGIDLSTVIPVTMPMPPTFGFPYVTLNQLASETMPTGAALVGFLQSGTGAVGETLQAKVSQIVNAADFGAVGDGVTDDTLALQAGLDYLYGVGGGILNLIGGKTYISSELSIGNGTQLWMNGATIQAISTLAASSPLLRNKNTGGAANTTIDNNMVIRDGTFLCTIAADRTAEFLSFIKTGSMRLENVTINGPRYFGIYLAGCKGTTIINPVITGTGKVAVTAEGGSAIATAAYGGDGSTDSGTRIFNPYIYSCNWVAISTAGTNTIITNPTITNVQEGGIEGNTGSLTVTGGIINGVTRKDISGSGMEINGAYYAISGISILNVDNCGISLSDVQNCTINGITTVNVRRDAVTYPTASHISIVSHSASPNQPFNISVTGHMAVDYSSPAYAAVQVTGSAGAGACSGISINGNNYNPGTVWSSGVAINVKPTYWNSGTCVHFANLGADDTSPGATAYQTSNQSIPNATATTLTMQNATPNSIGFSGTAWWVAGSPTRITVPENGNYAVSAQVAWSSNATGTRTVTVNKNGVNGYTGAPYLQLPNAGSTDFAIVNVGTVIVACNAGDYFELNVTQDSGGSLNTFGSRTWLSVRKLG